MYYPINDNLFLVDLAKRNVSKIGQEERMKSKMTSSFESDEVHSQKEVETRQEYGGGYHTPSSPQLSGMLLCKLILRLYILVFAEENNFYGNTAPQVQKKFNQAFFDICSILQKAGKLKA